MENGKDFTPPALAKAGKLESLQPGEPFTFIGEEFQPGLANEVGTIIRQHGDRIYWFDTVAFHPGAVECRLQRWEPK